MTELSQNDTDISCAVCDSLTRTPGYGQQFGTLQARWGYGSRHDGDHYRVYLCEDCFFLTLAFLRQERRTCSMFDAGFDFNDQHFGLLASDDYFGDS